MLHYLLQDPELAVFCNTCPALARQLRPLCHMLGIQLPDYLKLPPRPRPEGAAPRPPRQRTPRARRVVAPIPASPSPPQPTPNPPERLRFSDPKNWNFSR